MRRASSAPLVVGSLVAGLATYAYQVVGVRALGEVDYAPVSVLWTVQYIAFAIFLFPLEGAVADGSSRSRLVVASWVAGLAATTGCGLWLAADLLLQGRAALAAVGVAIVGSYGLFATVRGRLAAADRTLGYAWLTAGEATVRLALTPLVLLVRPTAAAVACLLPIGPPVAASLLALVSRRSRRTGAHSTAGRPVVTGQPEVAAGASRLVAGTVANAAVQWELAAGPLLVPLLGGGPSDVTRVFLVLTAARLPVFLALGGLASRELPRLLELRAADDAGGQLRWLRRTTLVGASAAAASAAPAALLGPPAWTLLYGSELQSPPALQLALVAAGVVLAATAMIANQLLLITASLRQVVQLWSAAFAAGALTTFLLPGSPLSALAVGMLVTQVCGLALQVAVAARRGARAVANVRSADRGRRGGDDRAADDKELADRAEHPA